MLDPLADVLLAVLTAVVNAVPAAGNLGVQPASGFASILGALDGVTGIGGPLAFVLGLLSAAPALITLRLVTWAYRLVPGKFT